VDLLPAGATLVVMNNAAPEEIAAGYDSLCAAGGAAVGEREVIAVSGADAATYLQGQISQDLLSIAEGSAWAFVLAPSGRVDSWVRIHRRGETDFFIEVEAGWGEATLARLKRFLMRTKAEIGDPQRWALVERRWSQEASSSVAPPEGAISAPAVGSGVTGIDLLLQMGAGAAARYAVPGLVPGESLERHRIVHAVPRMGAEITNDTIPGELGQWVIDASVSFTKGCYTGQELVARIDSRGNNVPHPIRLLRLGADGSVGDTVTIDGAVVGSLTSVTPALGDRYPAMALARVGRAVVVGNVVTVGEQSATVMEPGSV